MQGKRMNFGSVKALAVITALAVSLITSTAALASGGWGFGMDYGPSVLASCTTYNFVASRVDIPAGYHVGYVNGVLRNPRTHTSKLPVFGGNSVPTTGSVTLNYIVFQPPLGTIEGDVLHVELTLTAPGGGTVGSFGFSYNCSTGEVVAPAPVSALNIGYGDDLVAVASGVDSAGNPDIEVWCLDPSGRAMYLNMTLTKFSVAGLPTAPPENTLIDKNNSCRVTVAAYVLTSGEFQVIIGPDQDGVINNMIFTGLTPTDLHFQKYNVDQGL
jgi:hypothetical protein